MRDDECHASLGPRRVLLVVRLHPRDPRPRPDDEFLAVPRRRAGGTVECSQASQGELARSTTPIPRKDILKLRRIHSQKHARDRDEKQAQREHRDRVPPTRLPHARI